MLRPLAAAIIACAACAAADTWAPLPGFTVQPDGRVQVGGLTLVAMHYDKDWRTTTSEKAVEAKGAKSGPGWILNGAWKTAAGSGAFTETIAAAEGRVKVDVRLADAGPTNVFCIAIPLPGAQYRGKQLTVDGAAVALPAESPEPTLRNGGPAKLVEVPLAAGGALELSGDLKVFVQDNKKWGADSFAIRVLADAEQRVAVNLRHKP